jgi:hypothetical protein
MLRDLSKNYSDKDDILNLTLDSQESTQHVPEKRLYLLIYQPGFDFHEEALILWRQHPI